MDCLQVKNSDLGMSKWLALIVSLPVEARRLNTDINNIVGTQITKMYRFEGQSAICRELLCHVAVQVLQPNAVIRIGLHMIQLQLLLLPVARERVRFIVS